MPILENVQKERTFKSKSVQKDNSDVYQCYLPKRKKISALTLRNSCQNQKLQQNNHYRTNTQNNGYFSQIGKLPTAYCQAEKEKHKQSTQQAEIKQKLQNLLNKTRKKSFNVFLVTKNRQRREFLMNRTKKSTSQLQNHEQAMNPLQKINTQKYEEEIDPQLKVNRSLWTMTMKRSKRPSQSSTTKSYLSEDKKKSAYFKAQNSVNKLYIPAIQSKNITPKTIKDLVQNCKNSDTKQILTLQPKFQKVNNLTVFKQRAKKLQKQVAKIKLHIKSKNKWNPQELMAKTRQFENNLSDLSNQKLIQKGGNADLKIGKIVKQYITPKNNQIGQTFLKLQQNHLANGKKDKVENKVIETEEKTIRIHDNKYRREIVRVDSFQLNQNECNIQQENYHLNKEKSKDDSQYLSISKLVRSDNIDQLISSSLPNQNLSIKMGQKKAQICQDSENVNQKESSVGCLIF